MLVVVLIQTVMTLDPETLNSSP